MPVALTQHHQTVKTQIKAILSQQPDLGCSGWGLEGDELVESRADLLTPDGIAKVAYCIRFLSPIPLIQSINRKCSSADIKGSVAEWVESADKLDETPVIDSGCVIVAALALGLEQNQIDGSPDSYFNLSNTGMTQAIQNIGVAL